MKAERSGLVAEFALALREFHARCGAPSYRSVVVTARRLEGLYPDLRERDLPGLSVTAISEVLSGRRAGPPQAGWVLVFVLSCQRRAWEEGMLESDPGMQTAREWMERLQQVLIALSARKREHLPEQ